MKKKKAFTLVELLAVIVILAIILLIAAPNVMKIISNTKINAYNRQLDMLKDITKKYVTSYKIPVTEDLNISLKELYDRNMVFDVKDPRCGKNFKEEETIITATRLNDSQLIYSISPQTWCEGDATPPIINNINTNATTNSITVVVDALEDSGKIKKYYYSNDNGSNYIETTNSTYTFTNLNKDTNYEIKVIVENEDKLKTTSEAVIVKTLNIEGASFTVNPSGDVWAREKEVTITYPSDKGSLLYSYTLDGITYTEVVGNTYTHKFSENSSIQARITDGTNTIDTTQSVIKIDNTPPTLVSASTAKTTNSILVTANGIDNESGIKEYYYSKDNKATWIKGVGNTYNFTNLTSGTYNISVKLVNNAGGETISDIVPVTLSTIVAPTFTVNPSGDVWARDKTVTITYPSDKGSLVYSYTLDGITYTEVSGTTYTQKFTNNSSIQARITDGVNTIDTTQSITKIDNEAPTPPTSGNIGVVSGSNATGTIGTVASGSIDAGVGNITYKYLVTNTSTIPSKDDSRFTTSRNFTRSCGTSYYAYAIAEDGLGNKSEVKAIGSTSDSVNSYSGWSSCSASCGGGIQTRTNSCKLITSGLSQSCNTQSCAPILADTVKQGDYVLYDAGTWTSTTSYNPNEGMFGGYTAGVNKSMSVKCLGSSMSSKNGWRVFSVSGSGAYATITLIHAGSPECFRHSERSSYSESILNGSNATNNYVNYSYATSARYMNLDDIAYLNNGRMPYYGEGVYNDLVNIGDFYWLGTVYSNVNLAGVSGNSYTSMRSGACGVRPIVTLKTGLKKTGGTGTASNPYTFSN